MSKLSSKFEELATAMALFDNYCRSLLSVFFLVVFAEGRTGLNEIIYTQGESGDMLPIVICRGRTLYSSGRLAMTVW